MQPATYLKYFTATKALYSICVEPVCHKYGLNRTELDILLFLSNNSQYDTAAEICEIRGLAKSHVSTSIQALEKAGFLEKYQVPGDRRVIHLRLLPGVNEVLTDGRTAQNQFRDVLCAGMTLEEQQALENTISKALKNANEFIGRTRSC